LFLAERWGRRNRIVNYKFQITNFKLQIANEQPKTADGGFWLRLMESCDSFGLEVGQKQIEVKIRRHQMERPVGTPLGIQILVEEEGREGFIVPPERLKDFEQTKAFGQAVCLLMNVYQGCLLYFSGVGAGGFSPIVWNSVVLHFYRSRPQPIVLVCTLKEKTVFLRFTIPGSRWRGVEGEISYDNHLSVIEPFEIKT
jgi:hypothetical protein